MCSAVSSASDFPPTLHLFTAIPTAKPLNCAVLYRVKAGLVSPFWLPRPGVIPTRTLGPLGIP